MHLDFNPCLFLSHLCRQLAFYKPWDARVDHRVGAGPWQRCSYAPLDAHFPRCTAWFGSLSSFWFQLVLCARWEAMDDGSSAWVPASHVEDLDSFPGSWHLPGWTSRWKITFSKNERILSNLNNKVSKSVQLSKITRALPQCKLSSRLLFQKFGEPHFILCQCPPSQQLV